jgi:hypothetical protein
MSSKDQLDIEAVLDRTIRATLYGKEQQAKALVARWGEEGKVNYEMLLEVPNRIFLKLIVLMMRKVYKLLLWMEKEVGFVKTVKLVT